MTPSNQRSSEVPDLSQEELEGWLTGRLPDDLFTDAPEVRFDRDEIVIIGPLSPPESENKGETWSKEAERGRIERFREESREARMEVARAAEDRYVRKVSWGARCGNTTMLFTHMNLPIMTRLRFDDRAVLDALVDSGVARSRSEALSWCVRLVGKNETEWLSELREALTSVESVRQAGPKSVRQNDV